MRRHCALGATLSSREIGIACLVAQGMSNAQIAARLGIATMTVKNTVTAMLDKIGGRNRVSVAVYALKAGLISLECIVLPCEEGDDDEQGKH